MDDRLYLDHNATSPLRPQVRDVMLDVLSSGPCNPSSTHSEGRAAKARLSNARTTLGEVLSAPIEGIVFTGGGTEAVGLAIHSAIRGAAGVKRIFLGATEHDAVRSTAHAYRDQGAVVIEDVPVLPTGQIDTDWLARRLDSYEADTDGPFLLCAMLANNETGVINEIGQLGPLIWPKGGYLFVDAVQGFGKLPIDFTACGADFMAICGHKIGGPVGAGALLLKPGLECVAVHRGGGQESYRRAGTEAVAAIAGLAKAAELASPLDYRGLAVSRDAIEKRLPKGVTIWGRSAPRLGNTSCFSAPGFWSETQVMVMDLDGIAVSAGSACSSGKVRRSGVLAAMGASDDLAGCAIRVSFGWSTPEGAADRFVRQWTQHYERVVGSSTAAA